MFKDYYPYEYVSSVFAIDYQKLYNKGYRGIIFDIDNTLVHHGDDSSNRVDELFREIQGMGLKTILLTDNDSERVERFLKNIDSPYVCDANKPDTRGYVECIRKMNIKKEEAICIGDQIFTDILGANRSGIANILVKFVRIKGVTKVGKKRYLEYFIMNTIFKLRPAWHRLGDIRKIGEK